MVAFLFWELEVETPGSLRSSVRPIYNHHVLAEDQRERINVVLVSPRNPLNIGAAARAMANFGFRRLTVTAAYAPHWREARSAVGAPELLAAAVETETLGEAVAACTLVVGTGTLTFRRPEQRVVRLPELGPLVRRELLRGGRVGRGLRAGEAWAYAGRPFLLPSIGGNSDRCPAALDEPGPGRGCLPV